MRLRLSPEDVGVVAGKLAYELPDTIAERIETLLGRELTEGEYNSLRERVESALPAIISGES